MTQSCGVSPYNDLDGVPGLRTLGSKNDGGVDEEEEEVECEANEEAPVNIARDPGDATEEER